jgi:carboxymethylenebutenolidase
MPNLVSGGRRIAIDYHEPSGPGPFPAILLLHGSGGNIGFWTDRVAPYLSTLHVALYAVHYFDRTGTVRADATTILDGVHYPQWLATIGDALEHLRSRPKVDAGRIALLGISLGAFLALSAGVNAANRIKAIVEISGGMPEDYAHEVSGNFPPTLILHGTGDSVVPVSQAQSLDQLLTRAHVPHSLELLEGQGHWFDGGAQMRILMAIARFLGNHL